MMSRRIFFRTKFTHFVIERPHQKLRFFIGLIEFSYLYTIVNKVFQTWKYIKINSLGNWHIYEYFQYVKHVRNSLKSVNPPFKRYPVSAP